MRDHRRRKLEAAFAASIAVVLSHGCAGERAEGAVEPIIGGSASSAEDDAVVSVAVVLSGGAFGSSCTGVLLADNLLLTARHCVASTEDGGLACAADGSPISGGAVLADHSPADVYVFGSDRFMPVARGVRLLVPSAANLCDHDIALVVLEPRIRDARIAPVRLSAPPVVAETITAIGYGQSEAGGFARLRRAGVPIEAVGSAPIPFTMSWTGPSELRVGEAICFGDSGGPALADSTGAVVGVVARGGNGVPYDPASDPPWTRCIDMPEPYRVHGVYTRVDAHRALLLDGYAAAGATPWEEGTPEPARAPFRGTAGLGDACMDSSDCESVLCVAVRGETYCTAACDATTPCVSGYVCESNYCVRPPPITCDGGLSCVDASPALDVGAGGGGLVGTCSVSPARAAADARWGLAGLAVLAITARRPARGATARRRSVGPPSA